MTHRDVTDPVHVLGTLERQYAGDFSVAGRHPGDEYELRFWGDKDVQETAREVVRRCGFKRVVQDCNIVP